ncbi:PRC-barrel domain-containing protein [Alsobacter sp. R-9]
MRHPPPPSRLPAASVALGFVLLVAGHALGQSQAPDGAGSGAPGQPGSQLQPSTAAPASGQGGFRFRSEQDLGEWRGSKLIGRDVLGANGETLGNVRDMLVTEDGRITALVIGVGGLFGIKERLVGVPIQAVEFAARSVGATRQAPANPDQARTGSDPQITGATRGSTSSARDAFVSRGGEPTHLIVRVDKRMLEAAPRFQYAGRGSASGPDPVGAPGTSGMSGPPPATPPQASRTAQ